MSIVDRITEVLRAHEWDRCWWKCEGGTEWARAHPTHGHAAHVAEQIAELLVDLAGTGQLLASIAAINSDAREAK